MDQLNKTLNIALPKGRIGDKVYDIFVSAGYGCTGYDGNDRCLIAENPDAGVKYLWVKPADVPVCVERGAADLGVAGKDILAEETPDTFELLDLGVGICRLKIAAPRGFRDDTCRTLRVATKYPRIASEYNASLCREIDIIKLNGSIELAPLTGLSDVILDIVETGATLRENGLETLDLVFNVSARLIANKSAFRFKNDAITALCNSIKASLARDIA